MKRFQPFLPILCTLFALFALPAQAQQASTSPKGATAYFVTPPNGATVSGPVHVKFGLNKMTIVPAGVPHPDSGHHHLLIDAAELPPLDKPIPADAKHVHFGKGQTETVLDLAPGTHTLQLLLGDHLHRPHQPAVLSEKITITVTKPEMPKVPGDLKVQ